MVKQVKICTAGECNGGCYRCRLRTMQESRDELLEVARALREQLEARRGFYRVHYTRMMALEAAIAKAEGRMAQ